MRITRFVNLNYIILFRLIYSKHFYSRIIFSEIQNNGDLNDSINNININFNNHDSTLDITPGLIESESSLCQKIFYLKILYFGQNWLKRKKIERKNSTVATSEEWLQYHLYKENEKIKKQQDIEERRKKREEIREKKTRELKKNIKKEQIKKRKKK